MTVEREPEDYGMPEVMDECDAAALFQMQENQQALDRLRSKLAPETHPDFDGETCIDCGNDIPEERLAMGRIRCTECQRVREVKDKLYGRA